MSYRCDKCHSKIDCYCDEDPNKLINVIGELKDQLEYDRYTIGRLRKTLEEIVKQDAGCSKCDDVSLVLSKCGSLAHAILNKTYLDGRDE